MPDKIKLVFKADAALGEGPLWDFRRHVLYWVDITMHKVHIYDPSTGMDRAIDVGQPVGCLAPCQDGGLILGLQQGFGTLNIESGTLVLLLDPESHLPNNRFNDGKCDPRGRFWAGTLSLKNAKGAGSLYCLYTDMTVRTMLTGVTTSNGLAWSPDQKKLYYIDTPTSCVSAFKYDPDSGEISGKRKIISIPPDQGKPDGMTIDEEGMLWIAHWGGGCVSRWDPGEGRQISTIKVPAPNVTSCAFGGIRLDELYITTSRASLNEEDLRNYPNTGGLFKVKPGVRGIREPVFGG